MDVGNRRVEDAEHVDVGEPNEHFAHLRWVDDEVNRYVGDGSRRQRDSLTDFGRGSRSPVRSEGPDSLHFWGVPR
jgi:hypothetical protein